jgi:hypothetical protein
MTSSKEDKKRVDLDVRPHGPLYRNYDYGGPEDGEEDGKEVGPGRGLYNGPMDKYKSVTDFREKTKQRAYRKQALVNILITSGIVAPSKS